MKIDNEVLPARGYTKGTKLFIQTFRIWHTDHSPYLLYIG